MIKVTLGEVKPQEKPFPKLVTLSICGGVFLAISKTQIVCIKTGQSGWRNGQYEVGDFNFSKDFFTDYNDPITIQNA